MDTGRFNSLLVLALRTPARVGRHFSRRAPRGLGYQRRTAPSAGAQTDFFRPPRDIAARDRGKCAECGVDIMRG